MPNRRKDDPDPDVPAVATTDHRTGGRRDRLINGLLAVAAALSMLTLAVMSYQFSGGGPSEPDELLRIATDRYIAGEVALAGRLAESVELPAEMPLPPEADDVGGGAAATEGDARQSEGRQSTGGQSDAAAEGGDGHAEPPQPDEESSRRSLRQFLIGVGKVRQAESATQIDDRRRLWIEAVDALQRSAKIGFPPGRQADGNRNWGVTLVKLGRYNEATEPLRQAIDTDPTAARELLLDYATALYRSSPPQYAAADAAIQQFLQSASLPENQSAAAEEIRLRILLLQKQYDALVERIEWLQRRRSRASAEQITSLDSDRLMQTAALIDAVRIGLQPPDRTESAKGLTDKLAGGRSNQRLQRAIENLTEVVRMSAPDLANEARVWLGRFYRQLGQNDRAWTFLSEARQQRPIDPHGIVAALEELELLAQTGKGEEFLQATRYLVREIASPASFDQREISLADFRSRAAASLVRLQDGGQYESAIAAAGELPPLIERPDALIARGRAYRAWADRQSRDSASTGPHGDNGEDRDRERWIRQTYRRAGDAFAAAADALFESPSYVDVQWDAIDAYQRGRHFGRSIELLRPYLRYEDRRRSSRGLLALGRAQLAEGLVEQSIESFETCLVEQPRDPLRYDARLWIAKAYRELRQPKIAERYLLANLRDGSLTPQSPAWRDSLFALGETLMQQLAEVTGSSDNQGGVGDEVAGSGAADGADTAEATNAANAANATNAADGADGSTGSDGSSPNPDKEIVDRRTRQLAARTLRRLDEAVDRYWPRTEAVDAVYRSAQTDLISADLAMRQSRQPDLLPAARRRFLQTRDRHHQTAIEKLSRLGDHLMLLEERSGLGTHQSDMLRNALLLRGEVHRRGGQNESAMAMYQRVEQRFAQTPPALEAIMRRSDLLRRMGRGESADRLILQAAATLSRIEPTLDDQFTRLTRYDRRGWEDYLGWLQQQLQNGG